MVSISLGILNLLPIPVLDGGMILFLIIEAIRKKPLSRRTMEIAQSIGAAVLITLIAVVSYNDVMRAFFSK
jgi:regulator of sigma E protease